MSLLMEALKKAEQAKRKAAEAGTVARAATQSSPPPQAGVALELTPHEVTPPKVTRVNPAESPHVPAPSEAAKFTTIVDRVAPVAEPEKPLMPEQKAEIAPMVKPATAPALEISPLPAAVPPRVQPAAAPAASKSKITTGQRASRVFLWSLSGSVLLLMFGGGGYWYYNSMSDFLKSQTTKGLPQAPVLSEIPAPPVEPAPTPVAANDGKNAAPPKSVVVKPSQRVAPVSRAVAAPEPEPPAAPATPPISVSRNVDQMETFNSLQQAYRHYQNGDDARAQVLYAQVLDHEEHNRDALLGLAAIAVRQNDRLKAQDIYSELLTLDPRDTVAQAGFVGVTRSLDPLQQEARVKQMLEQEPNAPHLLFTYATFLMQQQRWGEASRVLLSAYQAQRDNPDYAFNLAVTLDHQGQNANALTYYRTALDLASKQSASFRADEVRRRIELLQAPREGGTP